MEFRLLVTDMWANVVCLGLGLGWMRGPNLTIVAPRNIAELTTFIVTRLYFASYFIYRSYFLD
jgi:hypothetical protein